MNGVETIVCIALTLFITGLMVAEYCIDSKERKDKR